MTMWPDDDDDFAAVVNTALKWGDEHAGKMRGLLGGSDVVDRTIRVLEAKVESIDSQLATWVADSEKTAVRERARDRAWDQLVWFRTVKRMHEVGDG